MRKYGLILIIFFACINLYWVFATPLLPFIDLPFHLAESFAVKNFSNAGYVFGKFYSIPTFLKSNTFHTFFCASGIFPDVETGNKIYYALYAMFLPLSVYLFIRTLKGNGSYALLSFLFLINHNVHWGFTGYTMSVPVLIFLFAVYYKYFIEKKILRVFFIIPLLLFLFSLHFQSAIFALLVFSVLHLVYHIKSVKLWAVNTAAMVPVILIMLFVYVKDSQGSSPLMTYIAGYYFNDYFSGIFERIRIFFILDNFFFFEGIRGLIYAASISVLVILLCIIRLKGNMKNNGRESKFLFIILIISACCYLFLPNNINGQNIIYERYSVIIFLLMITLTGTVKQEEKSETLKYIFGLILSALLINSYVVLDYMNDFKNESKDFSVNIFPEGKDKILAGVIRDNDFRGRKIWTHFPMYFTVWRGGITTGLIDYRFGLIKRNIPKEYLPQYQEWVENSKTDFWQYYSQADYLLERNSITEEFRNFILKSESGKWKLYRNILKTSP